MTTGGSGERYRPLFPAVPHPYQKTEEEMKFEAAAAIWTYAVLSEFGFTAYSSKTFMENLHAFGEWFSQRKAAGN